jgi:hypothetical protein
VALSTQIPLREPQVIAAGDSLEWMRQLNDFSANEWTLHYVLRNQGNIYKFDATNEAGIFLIQVASSVTATWLPGKYLVGAYVTKADEQKQVRTAFPNMVVGPNLAINPAGAPTISWAAQCLVQIEATIQALTSRTVETASVNGSAYTLANINDLFLLRERFKSEVGREEQQERLNAGLGAGNKVAVRFKSLNQQAYPPSQWWPPWQ